MAMKTLIRKCNYFIESRYVMNINYVKSSANKIKMILLDLDQYISYNESIS